MIALKAILILQSLSHAQSGVLYTLKDLAALEQEKNFEEFFQHVNDIRPSERQKLWKEMYQSMSMEMIDYKLKTKDFSTKTFTKIETLARSSALANDEFFQLKRSLYAKKFFAECYTKVSSQKEELKTCDNELSSFWYFSKKDPDIGLELVKIIENSPSKINTWPFYQRAINDSIASFYCDRPEVQRAAITKLTEEHLKEDFDGNYQALIKRFISDKCFDRLKNPLRLTLESAASSGIDKELAMKILSTKGLLSEDDENFYAVIYLLDGPVVGERMNIAWNRLNALSAKFNEREKILNRIKKLPLIPDKIFKDPKLSRHKAIINHFSKNFPEFLDYYARNCLLYLEHKSEEVGNIASSYQCDQFLKTAREVKEAEGNEWVSDAVSTKYSTIRKK